MIQSNIAILGYDLLNIHIDFRSESGEVHVDNRSSWAYYRFEKETLIQVFGQKSTIKRQYKVEDEALYCQSLPTARSQF